MYEYKTVIEAIANFVDTEIISEIKGWQKWVIGSGVGIALSDTTKMFEKLKDNDFIKMLGLIEEDKINVDKIYKELSKQAKKESITFDIPFMGTLTLCSDDVDKLYKMIKEK